MKTLLIFFTFIGILSAQQSEDPEFDALYTTLTLSEKIDRLSELTESTDVVKRNKYKKVLSYYLAGNYSTKWQGNAHGLSDLRNQMEKLRPFVRKLAASDNFDDRTGAINFMRYLTIDQEVEKMAYSILEKDTTQDGQRNCYDAIDLLFAYELETQELRQRLVLGLVDPETRKKYPYTNGAELYMGKWRLTEATDNLLLKTMEYYKKNGHVRCASLVSLRDLGYSARSVLPEIKNLLEERSKDPKADFREIELLNHTILMLEKKVDDDIKQGRNSDSDRHRASTVKKQKNTNSSSSGRFIYWAVFLVALLLLAYRVYPKLQK